MNNGAYPSDSVTGMDPSESLAFGISSANRGTELDLYYTAEDLGRKEKWAINNSRGNLVFLGIWGQPIRYRREDSKTCVIWDIGPNGKDENGGGDDIVYKLVNGEIKEHN